MELDSFFFDTYALIEIALGSRAYQKYERNVSIVTTPLNLMELYYCLRRENDKGDVDRYYNSLRPYAVDVDDFIIKKAMEFRLLNKKKKLSYVDCVGYVFARQNNLRFLTGDKAFSDLPGVEYVK